MSDSEIQRFIADLKSNEALRTELSSQAAGVGSVVEFAKANGYDVTAEDVSTHMRAQLGNDLSDEDLDAVAGGASTTASSTVVEGFLTTTGAAAVVSPIASEAVHQAAAEVVVGTQTAAAVVVT